MSTTDGLGVALRTAEKAARLTEKRALALPLPAAGYVLHWCPLTKGFGVRVTAAGARAWISERRVNGKTVRRTLGKVDGRNAVSADAARRLMLDVSSELQNGVDRLEVQRVERAEQKTAAAESALTLSVAVADYVKGKRRAKDGLPLKARTRADYLAMVAPGRTIPARKEGQPDRHTEAGELFPIAHKALAKVSADDVRAVFRTASARGARRGVYAMQVLRAVFNWHGVKIPSNPLGKDVAGKDRIVLGKTAGDPQPIPPERLAAWWKSATAMAGREAADYYRVMLLTGARSIELDEITVRDVDTVGGRLVFRDTKNRTDHTVLLPAQALPIVALYAKGKKPGAKLFEVTDPRKALASINASAGTRVRPHGLRATFASVAEELVSGYVLKRMLNHAEADDVTGGHYIAKSEAQLRAGWQTVADFITGAA